MRYLFILFICTFLPVVSFAQLLSFTETVHSNALVSELHKRATGWMISNTDYKESESNIHVGKSSTIYNPTIFYGNFGTKGVIEYKVIIHVQDNGYKYEIANFTHKGNDNNSVNLSFGELTTDKDCPRHMKGQRKGWENKVWSELKKVSSDHANKVGESIKNAMNTPSVF